MCVYVYEISKLQDVSEFSRISLNPKEHLSFRPFFFQDDNFAVRHPWKLEMLYDVMRNGRPKRDGSSPRHLGDGKTCQLRADIFFKGKSKKHLDFYKSPKVRYVFFKSPVGVTIYFLLDLFFR